MSMDNDGEERYAEESLLLEQAVDLDDEESAVVYTQAEELPEHTLPFATSRDLFLAHAALLDNTIVSLREDADTYRLVRTHFAALQQWHEHYTGWRIQRHSAFFRLERSLHAAIPVFLDDKLKRARDFTCLAWLLWFAEKRYLAGGGRNQQFLLSQLVEDVQSQSQEVAGEIGPALDFRSQQDRYSMWRALDYLMRLSGLSTMEGEVKRWAEEEGQPDSEVLFEFTPIAHSLIEAFNEQHVEMIMSAQRSTATSTPEQGIGVDGVYKEGHSVAGQQPPGLVRAWRTLLLGPAFFRMDDPPAFAALKANVEQVSEELSRSFGWLLELNRDYACIIRGGTLSAGSGPTFMLNSAYDQMVLLLCSAFRDQVEQQIWSPDSYGCLHVASRDILPLFHEVRQRYGSHWGTTVKGSATDSLLNDIFERMRQYGILRGPDAEDTILILPTAARYSVGYEQQAASAAAKATPSKTATRSKKIVRTSKAGPQEAFDW
ncbi:DUF2398 family protein [Ktedonobacteria bacterium brp13]|nr:DUF2398 family protein [Ktedonobacteria bacterium brp13]